MKIINLGISDLQDWGLTSETDNRQKESANE